MGRQIYLTDKEINALVDTCSEWSCMMSDGEETIGCVEDRMKDGLGSALYKLCKGTFAYAEVYKKYKK